jgi:hypothetical protein
VKHLLYVAGRFHDREYVRSQYNVVRAAGFELSADWTQHKAIGHYGGNPELSADYAREDIEGVRQADAFVLLTSLPPGGTGVHTELGVAIQCHETTGKPLVYVVGEGNDRSVMYFHPSVRRRDSLQSVLDELSSS